MMVVITEDKAKAVIFTSVPTEPWFAQTPHNVTGSGHEGRMPESRDGSSRASDDLSRTQQSSTGAAEMAVAQSKATTVSRRPKPLLSKRMPRRI